MMVHKLSKSKKKKKYELNDKVEGRSEAQDSDAHSRIGIVQKWFIEDV